MAHTIPFTTFFSVFSSRYFPLKRTRIIRSLATSCSCTAHLWFIALLGRTPSTLTQASRHRRWICTYVIWCVNFASIFSVVLTLHTQRNMRSITLSQPFRAPAACDATRFETDYLIKMNVCFDCDRRVSRYVLLPPLPPHRDTYLYTCTHVIRLQIDACVWMRSGGRLDRVTKRSHTAKTVFSSAWDNNAYTPT